MQRLDGPSTTAQGAPPIDLQHLTRQTFGDDGLQAELLDMFARQAKSIVNALQASLSRELDRSESTGASRIDAATLLHTLCGSARAIGSWRVAEQAESMERILRGATGAAAPLDRQRLMALGRSVAQVCRAIDELSHSRRAPDA